MATVYQNLSDYDAELMPPKEIVATQTYAIVVAEWNPEITNALKEGAVNSLVANGVLKKNIKIVYVPGTFELTHAASKLSRQRKVGEKEPKYDAIIVIGCVIQGETPHFTFVCNGVTQGVTELNLLPDGCPVIFGVLTTNTLQQAKDRAGGRHGNKGDEAAITAIKMANIVW
ncbi:MAG TPA: 6,7-dimethyl-8-ribityllumazine synthase [Bacteroidales bacterium]|nr:6,7-dimethyl-8-ribityllumazine synthase [Bacteroidales bacterium]